MNDSTIRLSADTTTLAYSLNNIATLRSFSVGESA